MSVMDTAAIASRCRSRGPFAGEAPTQDLAADILGSLGRLMLVGNEVQLARNIAPHI